MRNLAIAGILGLALFTGCGNSTDTTTSSGNAGSQADREYRACEKQAAMIADTQGEKAGEDKLDECVKAYANSAP